MSKKVLLFKDKIKTLKIILVRCLIRLFYIFPINKKRVVFFSYYGKQYSCNPKAISDYLLTNNKGNYEIIWAFTNPEDYLFLEKKDIKIVKYQSLKHIFLQATAKYTINNCGAFSWIPLRKNQFHINTWHAGGAYKRLTTGTSFNRHLTAKETTHMISGCKLFTKYNIMDCFDYKGKVLEIGMPRNDVFFDSEKMKKTGNKAREELKIQPNDFLVLYAPTWRYDNNIPSPNFEELKKAVTERFNKNVVIACRSHSVKSQTYENIIDATDYPDMQDLLCAADMLITDYSSSIWDFSFTYKPCFLYVEDLEKYEKEQGFLTDIREWGFPLCRNNEELVQNIKNYDSHEFRQKMDHHHNIFGSFEKGTAAKTFCEEIFS